MRYPSSRGSGRTYPALARLPERAAEVAELPAEHCDFPGPFPTKIPCQRWENDFQIFSSWGLIGSAATPTMTDRLILSSPELARMGLDPNIALQWELSMWARENARNGENLTAQNETQLSTAQHHTHLKGRVRFYGAAGGTERVFDIGAGVRFGVVACKVTLDVLAPTGFVVHPNSQQSAGSLQSGLVLDTFVGAWLAPAPCPPGDQILTDTYVYLLAAGNVNTHVPVPAGAVRLTMYQTNAGNLLTPFFRTMADIAAANIGEITLPAGRRVDHIEVPGPARVVCLNPAADNQNDRVVTLVWELEI
jgi:hypothetical protein